MDGAPVLWWLVEEKADSFPFGFAQGTEWKCKMATKGSGHFPMSQALMAMGGGR